MLSPRQELLLAKVIDGFAASGLPVGSKALAADAEVAAGPSTIRHELAMLEEHGLLAHPHTSAGRVPTDAVGGPELLRSLSVQFRGMGIPEQELVVTSTVREVADGVATVDAEARQGDTRVIRRGVARLDLS